MTILKNHFRPFPADVWGSGAASSGDFRLILGESGGGPGQNRIYIYIYKYNIHIFLYWVGLMDTFYILVLVLSYRSPELMLVDL